MDESEALFRALGDRRSIAVQVNLLGIMAVDANDVDTAQAHYEEALAIGRELNDIDLQVKEVSNLAGLALYQGDTTRAKELYEQALIYRREWNSKQLVATCLYGLAQAHILEGEFGAAETLLREALTVAWDQKKREQQGLIWMALGRVMAARGQAVRAACILGAVEANLQISTWKLVADDRVSVEQNSAAVRAALTPEEFESAFAAGRALTLEQVAQEILGPERVTGVEVQARAIAPPALRLCALGPTRVFSR